MKEFEQCSHCHDINLEQVTEIRKNATLRDENLPF
jgi:hypothetical protein